MDIRVLRGKDLHKALPMIDAISAIKDAFGWLSSGRSTDPSRNLFELPGQDRVFILMPSYINSSSNFVIKIVSVYPHNIEHGIPSTQSLVIVLDACNGRPLAIIEGGGLTAIRTGAASGVATDILANPEARAVAIFGSGVQARTQLEAVCTVRPIEIVWVYGIDKPAVRKFVDEMAGYGPIPKQVLIAKSPDEAIGAVDIICTATTSNKPVFDGQKLKSGVHINAIGSFTRYTRELDTETVRRALVVVDSKESALSEAGDLIIPIEQNEIKPEWIHAEIGEIINGSRLGRTDSQQITLFKSVGVGIQDAVVAERALFNAEIESLYEVIRL